MANKFKAGDRVVYKGDSGNKDVRIVFAVPGDCEYDERGFLASERGIMVGLPGELLPMKKLNWTWGWAYSFELAWPAEVEIFYERLRNWALQH